ncbi:hypothetical protein D8B26_002661 [Coccidioides posadasii str. Silveira]|uniref:Uncharacterized protein n=2 Tax=Coccidioides posadasii TaxID=199306 RepID=E9CYQ3_COCPS|nr:conserved hypothetical protein [Coccidioides posadasii str. Silveira]QVM07964.1 hypothetical protein D8B26_002661 [Coccidioides posadasii str. Silveira]
MTEAQMPSMLDYARFHGIARNHRAIDPLAFISPPLPSGLSGSLKDTKGCPVLSLDQLREPGYQKQKEKLNISKAGALFLKSAIRPSSSDFRRSLDWDNLLPDPRQIENIKQNPPLLRTDHENDMHLFRDMLSLDRMEVDLPLEKIDDEHDEGLRFPSYVRELPNQIHDYIANEKLDYLEPVTPPLLPRDSTPNHFNPSSAGMEMELLSRPITPVMPEHTQVERALAIDVDVFVGESSGLHRSSQNPLENFLEGKSDQDDSPRVNLLCPRKRMLDESFKVEGPLTPPYSIKRRRAEEEGMHLTEIVQMMPIPEICLPNEGEILGLDDVLKTSALCKENIELKLDKERIRGINADTRIETPKIVNLPPRPPWLLMDPACCQQDMMTKLHKTHDMTSHNQLSERDEWDLQWNPFPMGISRMAVEETIEGHIELSEFLGPLEGEGDGRCESPKWPFPHGTWLGDDLDDYILEPSIAIERDALSLHPISDLVVSRNSAGLSGKKQIASSCFIQHRHVTGDEKLHSLIDSKSSLLSSNFSTTTQLSNFINLRGKTKQTNASSSPYFTKDAANVLEARENDKPDTSVLVSHLTLPAPEIAEPPFPLSFVISTALLRTHRSVVQVLESLPSPKTLIFRDYHAMALLSAKLTKGKHENATSFSSETSLQTLRPANCYDDDADIIISPTTAILLTKSQETTQLHLPGHSPLRSGLGNILSSPLRERIFRVCSRYERLYVLIGHALNVAPTGEEAIDAIRALESFCSSLAQSCNVVPLVVPAAVEHLTQWIINLAKKHAMPVPWSGARPSLDGPAHAKIPSEDATVWEIFLYHAGLNLFAAQAVLTWPVTSLAKFEEDAPPADIAASPYATLSRFVGLPPKERKRIYAPLIGERIASNISNQLDGEW